MYFYTDNVQATFKFTRNAEESRAQKHREWRAAQQAVLLKTEKRNDHGVLYLIYHNLDLATKSHHL